MTVASTIQPVDFPATVARLRAERQGTPSGLTPEALAEEIRRGKAIDRGLFDRGKTAGRTWATELATLEQLERLRLAFEMDEFKHLLFYRPGDGQFIGNRLAARIGEPPAVGNVARESHPFWANVFHRPEGVATPEELKCTGHSSWLIGFATTANDLWTALRPAVYQN